MSIFSSWVLSITGIAVLGIMMDLILPEGQMQKYVKAVFSFLVVFVIISPFPKLFQSKLSIEEFFGTEQAIQIQTQFIGVVNMQKKLALEKNIVTALDFQGVRNIKATVTIDYLSNQFKIDKISIDVGQVIITTNLKHIDMLELVKHTTKQISGIGEDKIEIYER